MALRSDWSTKNCPIARSLDVVGDPWILLIVREALMGTRRFDQFRTKLGVADTVLSRRLGAMVDGGLLAKVPYRAEQRVHHEYELTAAGADLLPLVNALLLWGEKHTPTPATSGHLAILHIDCDAAADDGPVESSTAEVCSRCGRPLVSGAVAWDRSWVEDDPTVLAGAGSARSHG
ncbi:transcriptional regulator [Nakamurella silvestris]|nr:transcriptional regulator [Nakamurella silvestris]